MRYARAAARVIRPRGPKAASVPPLARPRGRGDSAFGRRRCIRRKSCKLQDLLQNAVMDEIAPGILHWQARHPKIGIDVSSYWLPGLRLLLDPVATPDKVEQVEHILPPAGTTSATASRLPSVSARRSRRPALGCTSMARTPRSSPMTSA